MARITIIALALFIGCGPLSAQRNGPIRTGPVARPTPPRGSAGGRTATERGRNLGKKQIQKERKQPKNGGSPSTPSPTPPTVAGDPDKEERAPRILRLEERKRVGRVLVAAIERDLLRVRNQTLDASLMVLDTRKGKAERLKLRHWMRRDETGVWHRFLVSEESGKRRGDLLLFEKSGVLRAWKRRGDAWSSTRISYGSNLVGTPLVLEDLLPLETFRYSWEYEGESRRLGRLVHGFHLKPKGARGASRRKIVMRVADRLPALSEEVKGERRRSKGSRAATRDGILAFERWTFEYPKLHQSVVMRVLTRVHNRGVAPAILDPEK